MKRVGTQELFSYAVFFLCLLVALFVRARWEDAPVWDGDPPFEQKYPNEHQFLAACRQGRVDVMEYWLNLEGFRPNDEFISGRTGEKVSGLFLASQEGHIDGVKLLIKAGADLNQTRNCVTPLYRASQNGHAKVVEILVKAGADLNQSTEDGAAPLFMASQNGHDEAVEILVKAGADPTRKWHIGLFITKSPLTAARQAGHDQIVKILKPAVKTWKEQKKIQAQIDGNTGCFDGFVDALKNEIKHTVAPLMTRVPLKSKGY